MDYFSEGQKKGKEHFLNLYSGDLGGEYIDRINEEVTNFNKLMEKYNPNRTPTDKLKGNVAEAYHTGTYNINATVKDKSVRVVQPTSNELGSADIEGEWFSVSLKYYKTARKTYNEQTKTFYERYKEYKSRSGKDISYEEYLKKNKHEYVNPGEELYLGQERVVPSEQLPPIKEFLEKFVEKNKDTNPEMAQKAKDLLGKISDRVSKEGVESIPLSTEEAVELTELVKKGDFDAKTIDRFKIENLVDYGDIFKKAAKSALSAALISAVIDIAPAVFDIIESIIQNEDIDKDLFAENGIGSFNAGSRAFVRGFVSSSVTACALAGKFGEALKSANPNVVAALTVVVLNAIEGGYQVCTRKITKREYADNVANDVVTALGYFSGKALVAALVGTASTVALLAGSLIGAMIAGFVYKKATNFVMAFCVKTGWTMFGLVEQDYTLPDEVARELCEVVEPKYFEPVEINLNSFEPVETKLNVFNPDTVNIKFLRRGVIGVGRIGYI